MQLCHFKVHIYVTAATYFGSYLFTPLLLSEQRIMVFFGLEGAKLWCVCLCVQQGLKVRNKIN